MTAKPLAGVRVLDLTRLLPGPFATLVLADMGARVDKIESPEGGDYLRHKPLQIGGQNAAFLALNRGKRSMVLDLKQPEGRETLERLLPRYDVLVESFRPGVLERLDLGHAKLRARFPRLIVGSITGYGLSGPLAHHAGHDLNYLARSGVLGMMGPVDRPPQLPSFQAADIAGGMWAVIGILGALRQRDSTGEGAFLEIAMSEALLPFAIAQLGSLAVGQPMARGGETLTGGLAPYSTYATKEGRFVALAALEPKFWQSFCKMVGLEYEGAALVAGPHQASLRAKLEAIFLTKTRDEWAKLGATHDCCLEPVLEPEELESDPHLQARGVFIRRATPFGESLQLRLPVGEPSGDEAPPPAMGEHSDQILAEAGFCEEKIAALRASKIVQ